MTRGSIQQGRALGVGGPCRCQASMRPCVHACCGQSAGKVEAVAFLFFVVVVVATLQNLPSDILL